MSALAPANRQAASEILSFYRCPSFTGPDFSDDPLYVTTVGFDRFAIRNYVAMGARTIVGLSGAIPADGVMYPGSRTGFRDITDGTSNTIMIAETRETKASVWIDGTTASVAARSFALPAQLLNLESLADLFRYSLALSAWKEYGASRWALRINPSSGNVPTIWD